MVFGVKKCVLLSDAPLLNFVVVEKCTSLVHCKNCNSLPWIGWWRVQILYAIKLLCCPLGKHNTKRSQNEARFYIRCSSLAQSLRSTRLVNTRKNLICMKKIQQKLMRFIFDSVAVHFRECCGPLSFIKKLKKRQQKLMRESLCPTKRNHEVHLTVCCSAVFHFDAVRSSVR